MKTQINGVEITPKIAEVFESWYNSDLIEYTYPYECVVWLSELQDYITRIFIEKNSDDKDMDILKSCICTIVSIKDEFKKLIPERKEEIISED